MKKLFLSIILGVLISVQVFTPYAFAADWYAQNSSVNIDSANQWNSAADGSGSYLTWASLGATDNLYANGKTAIAINGNFTCGSIRTDAGTGTEGGEFITVVGTPVTVSADIVVGATTVLTPVSNTGTISWDGDIYFVGTTTSKYGVYLTNSGNAFNDPNGVATGGSVASCSAIYLSTSSTFQIGTAVGGSYSSAYGVYSNSTGTGTVKNATGGTNGAAGVNSSGTGAVTITGIMTNQAYGVAANGGIIYSPSDNTSYILWGTKKFVQITDAPATLTDATIKSGTVAGDVTGTYSPSVGGVFAW